MNRQISFEQYRTIDLTILLAVLGVCQYLTQLASTAWFPDQLYVVSPVAAMTALVMMRWGGWAAIHAAAGGLLFTFLSGGTAQQYLIYGVGNLAALAALVMFRFFGKERIRQDTVLALVFGLCAQVLMQLGRAGIAAVLGYSWEACLGFLTTDSLSVLFTLFVVWIVRRTEGLFEDQKHYLLRIQSEQENEGREQF